MPMTGDDWISRHFQPLVDALPEDPPDLLPGGSEPQLAGTPDQQEFLRGIIGLRLHAAMEALETVGVLTTSQVERCQAALNRKGLAEKRRVVHMTGSGFVTGTTSAQRRGQSDAPVEPSAPDQLMQVLAVNRILGLIDDEPCRMTCVEIWQQSVHAHLLVQVSEAAVTAEQEQAKAMQDWIRRRQDGLSETSSRPPLPHAALLGGNDLVWSLDIDGRSYPGHLVAGRGDGSIRRLEIAWPVHLSDGSHTLDITVTQDGSLRGRLTLNT